MLGHRCAVDHFEQNTRDSAANPECRDAAAAWACTIFQQSVLPSNETSDAVRSKIRSTSLLPNDARTVLILEQVVLHAIDVGGLIDFAADVNDIFVHADPDLTTKLVPAAAE